MRVHLHRQHSPALRARGHPEAPPRLIHQLIRHQQVASTPLDAERTPGSNTLTTEAEPMLQSVQQPRRLSKKPPTLTSPQSQASPCIQGPRLQTGTISQLDVTTLPSHPPIPLKSLPSTKDCTWPGQPLGWILRAGLSPALKDRTCGSDRGRHWRGSPDHAGPWDRRAQPRSSTGGSGNQVCDFGMSLSGLSVNGGTGKTLGGSKINTNPHSRVTKLRCREVQGQARNTQLRLGLLSPHSDLLPPARTARPDLHVPPSLPVSSRGRVRGPGPQINPRGHFPKGSPFTDTHTEHTQHTKITQHTHTHMRAHRHT